MRQSKHKKIKRNKEWRKQWSDSDKGSSSEESWQSSKGQVNRNGEKNMQEEEQLNLKPLKFMEIPMSQVPHLEAEERAKLRQQFPNLADYIFMSQREKTKYFHQKNLTFRKVIETPGNLPARKIQFKRKFQVKVFDSSQPSSTIQQAKSKKYKYDPKIHHN